MSQKSSQAGRDLRAFLPTAQYQCNLCGKEFHAQAIGGKSAPRFCSTRCRQRSWYEEKKKTGGPSTLPVSGDRVAAALSRLSGQIADNMEGHNPLYGRMRKKD